MNPRFQGENFKRNLELVEKVKEVARRKGVSSVQLALAWVLGRGRDVVPIPGTTRREHLEENAVALEVRLTESELEELEGIFPLDITAGERYPDMSSVDR